MKKSLFRTLFIVLLTFLVLLLLNIKIPDIKNIFRSRPVVIDNTPILIKEIRELAQLCTITSAGEVVADSSVIRLKSPVEALIPDLSGFGQLPVSGKNLVIIGRGKVIAGVDLQKLNTQSVYVKDDSISLTLPKAEILDIIMNPSGFEIFSETGDWSSEAVTAVKMKARDKMVVRSLQQGILSKANLRSIMLMENFLYSLGFRQISVQTNA
ncbi:MAG: DUF4230 domain-containing protein [Chitinophagaceae bacterium]|nr:DUF4230 domain-containing protein [Chitinophagaceae bacterium]